ncbi:hypothetical protein SDC9_52696 [bioreactor metagenome]|uniref:Uncharacterized protein n=1 Tax=bioreactor metagenome TaxID=1076179 RepID=A0A644WRV1_9ZZZZ|nr:hypothetical protein [Sedimentibacter saalensis]MEA5095031.1 hypothetical protein [Sedimentibacter saalensis]
MRSYYADFKEEINISRLIFGLRKKMAMDLLGNIWYNIFKTTLNYTDSYGGYGSY